MFECFHCLQRTVVWDCDYSFEDMGYEGDGIVQILHCSNCGAEIEYRIPLGDEREMAERLDYYVNEIRERRGMDERE